MVPITQLPRIKPQFIVQVFDPVIARHDHNPNNDKARYRAGLARYERSGSEPDPVSWSLGLVKKADVELENNLIITN